MSKILANEIANYGDNAPIELKEGLNIPDGKPLQAAGVTGSNGQVLTSTGATVQWTTPFDGDYNSLANRPTIPAAQVQSDWNAVGTLGEILNKPIVPPQPSVVVNPPSSNGNLVYNQGNGLFTFTPPDLSPYALASSVVNSANWDLAYSWGDHAAAGYATAAREAEWDAAYGWGDHALAGYLTTGLQDLVDDTTPQLGGTLDLNGFGITGTGSISCTGLVTGSNSLLLGSSSAEFIIQFSQNTGTSPQIRNSIGTSGIGIYGAYNFGSTHEQDVHLGTSGQPSWFKNVEPRSDSTYDLGTSSKKWANFYVDNLHVSGTTDILLENLGDVDTTGLSDQQILKWDAASSSWKAANDLVGGQSAIELADLSVTVEAAGSANLSYNNTNGVFTYTPPDLSSYLTAETDPVFSASVAAGILQTNVNNWNTAYGWGNHATAGYATTTQLNTAVANSSNWDTAYSWGDHATVGYLTSYTETQTLDDVLTLGATTTQDITTTGKVYYSNAFPLLTDLQAVSPSTYHGMFAHAHDAGHGYVAHAGAWIQLLDTGSSIGELADVDLSTSPSTGQVLKWNGANWSAASGATIANVTISDTAPGSAVSGDLWWESDKGRLKIYYNDTDSSQWVDASPPLAQPNVPVAAGFITLNGTSPTWTGTTGYTVSGAQPGGAGTDYEITLTFPTAYSARTDYIVQATYDGTNYISANGAQIAVARGTSSVVFTPRRWDENPLSLGEIMVTITNL